MFTYEIRFSRPGQLYCRERVEASNPWDAVAQLRTRHGAGIQVHVTCCL